MKRKTAHGVFLNIISNPFLFLLIIFSVAMNKPMNDQKTTGKLNSYLALGDSYTIGEQVAARENFPNQVVAILKEKGIEFSAPQIIAQTGWTTDELQNAINNATIKTSYDFVTLLIGVNNQYRGRTVENYIPEFESLLKQAIHFAGNDTAHVIVLSIPDWGATPFANGRDRSQIAKEIDAYNLVNENIAKKYNVHYVNITAGTREAANDASLLATDGLHPSGKEYEKWATQVAHLISKYLN